MRKNFCAQPWVYPQPVLIIAMYLSDGHKTVKNILKRGAFTVSMGDAEHAAACDYVGIESGNSVPDKVARAGFHVTKSEHVDAPVIDELPLALECKLSVRISTLFVQNRRISVKISLKTVPFTTGTGAGQVV